mmetsp:Transcript_9069/g.37412  ORF Transcript_9069/g.37412 Transcript_9069/m.37412 type:complete len:192 (-) Transcript_9069:92-667(-)
MSSEEAECIKSVLFTKEQIAEKVAELGKKVSQHYEGKGTVVVVGILKGSFIFMADLVRQITVPHQVGFMALSSYGSKTVSAGAVRIIMDLRTDIAGKHVLIVEDIIDSGYTLRFLLNLLKTRSPASISTCVFLRKLDRLKCHDVIKDEDFVGFDIPDEWVVGYGLDYDERFRTMPYVGILKRTVYESGAEE